jgi:organic radical activating enzyme
MTITGKRPNRSISTLQEWQQYIESLPHWASLINISGGEPSLVSYLPEFVNWLVSRGHHVNIYSTLFNPKNLERIKKSFKVQITADYHKGDSILRFNRAYNYLKDKIRINVEEIEQPKLLSYSRFVGKFTAQEILDFTSFHAAPDSPRTGKLYIGCESAYHERTIC